MYKLYEKVRKTAEYKQGARPIEQDNNPFLEGPTLFCLSAQYGNSLDNKSNFGVTKQGMKMARLRVRGAQNAGFDLKNFPAKFLCMKLDREDEKENNKSDEERFDQFFNKYFLPLISDNGAKIDVVQAMKNMRNVNIMSYCDGTLLVQKIENKSIQKMQELGYTEEECNKIQSQMCMFPIATERLNGTQKSTCIEFRDINDEEVSWNTDSNTRDTIEQSEIGEEIIKKSNNEVSYLVAGDGKHSLKKYTGDGKALAVCISSVISKALQNSIENSINPNEFTPISTEKILEDLPAIMQKAGKEKDIKQLFQEFDTKLEYKNARKLSQGEIELLDQLDESYDMQIKEEQELKRLKAELESRNNVLNQNENEQEQGISSRDLAKTLFTGEERVKGEEYFQVESLIKEEMTPKKENITKE